MKIEKDICESLHGETIVSFTCEHCDSASLAAVAERFCCHPNSISRILKREVGASFQEVLITARMERAAHMLQSSNASVDRVATACGYESMAHFYQMFKRTFSTTPAQFKTARKLKQAP